MKARCTCCKHRLAQPVLGGTDLCTICHGEACAFLDRFSRGESVVDSADRIAAWLIGAGGALGLLALAVWPW
jgi:hypothetical protein